VLPASYITPAAVIFVVGGALSCFAGYRLFRFVLGLFGFVLGAVLTAQSMAPHGTLTMGIAAIVGGLVGTILMVAAYFIGVGLVGAGLVALIINAGWHLMGRLGPPPTLLLVVGCVIGALTALSIQRFVIIFGTALAGSWMAIVGALALTGDAAATRAATAGDVWMLYPVDPAPGRWWIAPAWLVISLAGILAQLATSSKTGKAKAVAKKKGV